MFNRDSPGFSPLLNLPKAVETAESESERRSYSVITSGDPNAHSSARIGVLGVNERHSLFWMLRYGWSAKLSFLLFGVSVLR